jgi:hypothetical protein
MSHRPLASLPRECARDASAFVTTSAGQGETQRKVGQDQQDQQDVRSRESRGSPSVETSPSILLRAMSPSAVSSGPNGRVEWQSLSIHFLPPTPCQRCRVAIFAPLSLELIHREGQLLSTGLTRAARCLFFIFQNTALLVILQILPK